MSAKDIANKLGRTPEELYDLLLNYSAKSVAKRAGAPEEDIERLENDREELMEQLKSLK